MKRKKFEERLYLFIKGELSEPEMIEMKSEIDRSPERKMLYEKMCGFLKDSKRLLKKLEIIQFENKCIVKFNHEAQKERHKKIVILKSLSAAASLLLIAGLIYISIEHNGNLIDPLNRNNIGDLAVNDKHSTDTTQNKSEASAQPDDVSKQIKNMTAELNIKSGQKTSVIESPPVKRIVYLTDDPKVKIYWMAN
jgi:hypothetical protein